MKLREFVEEQEELNEGIKFFKTSKKFKTILDRLNKRLNKIEDGEDKEKAKEFVKKMEKRYKKYKKLEDDYKNSKFFEEKRELKEKYKKMLKEDKKLINSHFISYKKVLLAVGVYEIAKSLLILFTINTLNDTLELSKTYNT